MTPDELKEIIEQHALHLSCKGGKRADLSGADLRDADLSYADLSYAVLSYAVMRGADLRDAVMRGAALSGADLSGADLRDADLSYADLSYAVLSYAVLSDADLRDADLSYADLRDADLSDAALSGADLGNVVGNMREVKSSHFDKWAVAWTQSPERRTTLQIGCQRHDLSLWEQSDQSWIAAMDDGADDWWSRYREIVLSLVSASPATPYGNAEQEGTI